MQTIKNNGYVSAAILMNNTIREMRRHVEFEKFLCRMLVDNDDTRQMKQNTEEHPDSIHRFIYNNDRIDEHTMRGKYEAIGKSAYVPTDSGVIESGEINNIGDINETKS